IGALYGIYLLYLGLPRLMKNPAEKTVPYLVVTIIAAIVLGAIVATIGSVIAGAGMVASGALGMGSPAARHSSGRVDPAGPLGQLEAFGKQMEEANKKMDAAQKSGDPNKQAEAAMAALGTAISGGKGVEPLQLDQIKGFVPDTFAGLPRTGQSSERSGAAGF